MYPPDFSYFVLKIIMVHQSKNYKKYKHLFFDQTAAVYNWLGAQVNLQVKATLYSSDVNRKPFYNLKIWVYWNGEKAVFIKLKYFLNKNNNKMKIGYIRYIESR